MFEKLGVSQNERLLAALFVEYPETMADPKERLPGKQRSKRSPTYRVDARDFALATQTERFQFSCIQST